MKKSMIYLAVTSLLLLQSCANKKEGVIQESTTIEEKVLTEEDLGKLIDAAIINKNSETAIAGLAALMDSETGLYLILREGNVDMLKKVTTSEELAAKLKHKAAAFEKLTCEVKKEDLPEFTGVNEFSKTGCFYTETSGLTTLANKQKQLTDFLGIDFTDEEKTAATAVDSSIGAVAVITQAGAELSFAKKQNTWKLVIINLAKFDSGL
jgi:hypothetical protein